MDATADFTTGIWAETVATVEIGAVEITGAVGVGVVDMGWAITLTLYLLLMRMVLLLLSRILCLWAFLVIGLLFWGRCTGAWLWLGLGLRPVFGTKLTL